MMKNIVRLAALCALMALCLSACKKKDTLSVVGCWQLESVETRATIGDVEVDVYISFTAEKTFDLYQMLGEGRFRHFSGSYTLTGNILDGTYSDGNKWASSYEVSREKGTLTLSSLASESGTEVSTYISIPEIPETSRTSLY